MYVQRKRQNNDDNRHTNQRGPSAQAVHGAVRERYGAASRRVAWLTLFSFLVSPATAVFAGSDINNAIDTAIGNANTHDGVFTENTQFNTTFEQNTGNAVIKWDVMDQEADNTLTFVQGAGDRVLNQASGIRASVFRGMIRCDATCIFANEAGVTFADGSYLDVGQLVTIAGAVSEASFRDGGLHATGITGDVNNYGIINARDVMLVGARIANGGEINIEDGTLTAIIGSEVWLREHGSNVVVHAELPELRNDEGFDAAPGIDNSGTINAGSGNVRLLAGDLLSFGIRNTGRIEASDISLDAGGLIELSGPSALDASDYSTGAVGGTIKVLGGYIAILDTATLDASGHSGGGEILVGGEQAGASGTRTSQGTYVGNNTTLRADASHTGDGGRIIVWSDKTTRSYGTITARGGTLSGNGGFVETSGREYLDVQSSPLIHARSGNATDHGGEWL
ncbi:MAG: filamentous hemagglutinin family protein, partial [Candidatus Binatia bacterium]